jgi:DnaJ-class molecular chaperone
MSALTFYELLEVSPTDTEKDIKKASKKMLLKWHPDKNLNDQEHATLIFKEIQNAVEILTDPIRRKEYDDQHAITGIVVTEPKLSIPKPFVPNRTRESKPIEYTLYLPDPPPLITTFTYPRDITCPHCVCKSCNGTGIVQVSQVVYGTKVQHQTACNMCKLYQHHNRCRWCNGTRIIVSSHTMSTRIPKHCKNGSQLYFPNEGHQLSTGNTNLIVTIKMTQ